MDTKLYNGDFEKDERGLPRTIDKNQALLQRCLIRLQVPKGSFLLDRTLGSDLHLLLREKPGQAAQRAAQLAAQALEPIREVSVERAEVLFPTEESMRIHLTLLTNVGERLELTVG